MKKFEPIPVYPLNMRGRFGLTRHIYHHGFASVFFYTLFYALLCALLAALCVIPAALRLFSDISFHQLLEKGGEFFRSLFNSYSQGPDAFFWSWEAPNDFLSDGGSIVFGILGSIGLSLLALGFYAFYLKPRYLGTVYNEMGARIYGSSGSVKELSHRAGFCLRRYYTTYLALIVGKIGASVVISFIARALGLVFAGIAFAAIFISGAGGVLAWIVLFLISLFMGYISLTLLTLCYPVSIAEGKRDFSALGRGISLGWRNFGRVFSSLLLRDLYIYLWMLPGTILLSISAFSEALRVPLLLAAFVWIAFVRLYFIPFRLAFDTVLYYDAVAREMQSSPAVSSNKPRENDEVSTPADEADASNNNIPQSISPEKEETVSETVFEAHPEGMSQIDDSNNDNIEQDEEKE